MIQSEKFAHNFIACHMNFGVFKNKHPLIGLKHVWNENSLT